MNRYILALLVLAGTVAGQQGEDSRQGLEVEPVVPTGRFSFQSVREALETECQSPGGATQEALCWNDRGLWHQLQGQYTQAEAMYTRAIAGFEKGPVIDRRLLATTLHNLGAAYRELRRLEDAKQALSRALALRQDAYGDDHPLTANTLSQLGIVHLATGELTQAEGLLRSAVSTHERFLPAGHVDRVASIHNLAQLRIAQTDYKSALKLLQELVVPLNNTTDPSLVQAAPYQTLAALYRRLGQPARALPLLKKAQRLYEDSFGPDDITAALVRVEFGLLSAAEGNNRLAKAQLREARERLVKIVGADHPQVASAENNLAVVCLALGEVTEAGALLERARQSLLRTNGASEQELGANLTNLAEVRRRQGRLEDSEAHLREALGLFEHALAPDSPEVLWVLEQYATVLKARRSPGVQNVLIRMKAIRSRRPNR